MIIRLVIFVRPQQPVTLMEHAQMMEVAPAVMVGQVITVN
jgi:hypothetical protein